MTTATGHICGSDNLIFLFKPRTELSLWEEKTLQISSHSSSLADGLDHSSLLGFAEVLVMDTRTNHPVTPAGQDKMGTAQEGAWQRGAVLWYPANRTPS